MMLFIDDKAGLIEISRKKVRVPGIVHSITVGAEVLFDDVKETDASKTVKVLTGFKDATVTVSLSIVDPYINIDSSKWNEQKKALEGSLAPLVAVPSGVSYGTDRYAELKKLNDLFRYTEKGCPVVYVVNNKHLQARGIATLVFSGMESVEEDWGIACTLSFVEHNKKIEKTSETQKKNDDAAAAKAAAPAANKKNPDLSMQEQIRLNNLNKRLQK
jgi:hypothetical protein